MKNSVSTTHQHYFAKLSKELSSANNDEELFKLIVNTPFKNKISAALLGLGIVVFLLIDKETKTLKRVALSETEQAEGAVKMSVKPFKEIVIPADYDQNMIIKAIQTGNYQQTTDWQYLFNPALTPEEARFNQAGAGIACSVVYPLKARDGGALIFSYFFLPEEIGEDHHKFMSTYVELVCERLSSPGEK